MSAYADTFFVLNSGPVERCLVLRRCGKRCFVTWPDTWGMTAEGRFIERADGWVDSDRVVAL